MESKFYNLIFDNSELCVEYSNCEWNKPILNKEPCFYIYCKHDRYLHKILYTELYGTDEQKAWAKKYCK